ncbi:DUF692 domain-containing protein [Streptomyces flavofungini]|uniref:DUF692 domain-containing protein n=1 Tax=Streptomyces flavofungini TaxID=68200 RepID=A0ABS0X8K5_9ACTN|nr:DUF692 domain-containing protein [Streptomyces flavofungini]MBJ3809532.1 DUF692 domain-containing protein [Streptomyces flavofungini]GHC55357.1 UPF0276 protein [Streptomyces flavofungini]
MAQLGTGIGWRPEIADAVERMPGIDWVEAVAENVCPGHLPDSLLRLRERGVTVVPHGVSLGLGGAEPPDEARLRALAERAEALGSPLVTEHIAFVRAGGALTASPHLEAGHLLPVPRTRDALAVLCENVRIAQDALPVPLAVENIAALISWPGEELTEGQFLYELVERTGVRLLIDVANLHTNHVNRGEDPARALDELPVEAIAYVHVAGGFERDGVWHDSHAHPVPRPVLDILADLAARTRPPGVLLERDENFPEEGELERELAAIRETVETATPMSSAAAPVTASAPGFSADTGDTGDTPDTADTAPALATAPAAAHPTTTPDPTGTPPTLATRQRVALAQAALLSALVAGTPAPEGFDGTRLRVQSRALGAKRADVVAKVAPELPWIVGDAYRAEFLDYARTRPMTGGYRQDALDFAEHLLLAGRPEDAEGRGELTAWWLERSGPKPLDGRPLTRWLRTRAARLALRRARRRTPGHEGVDAGPAPAT